MSTQLQPAEMELKLVTAQAEVALDEIEDEAVRRWEEVRRKMRPVFQRDDLTIAEKQQMASDIKKEYSWDQQTPYGENLHVTREGGFDWGKRKIKEGVWEGLEAIQMQRITRSAGNMVAAVARIGKEGLVTGGVNMALSLVDAAMTAGSLGTKQLKDSPLIDHAATGLAKMAMEGARLAILYGPSFAEQSETRMNKHAESLPADMLVPNEDGDSPFDLMKRAAITAAKAVTPLKEIMLDTEAKVAAASATMDEVSAVGKTLMRSPLGDHVNLGGLANTFVEGTYDFKKAQIGLEQRASIDAQAFLLSNLGSMALKKLNLAE